jgi:hypothetical protein
LERTKDADLSEPRWTLHEQPMCFHDQLRDIVDEGIVCMNGHTATYFPNINGILVYGGGNESGLFVADRCLWVLHLGSQKVSVPKELGDAAEEKINDDVILKEQKHRSSLKWEKINVLGSVEDAQRIGHQSVAYLNHLYIFGGFNGTSYLSKVHRIEIDKVDEASKELTWRINSGVHFEQCSPRKQSYTILKENMMSPRAGHSATGFEKYVYVFGGATNGYPCTSNVHMFNTESYEWKLINNQGGSPSPRFSHAATKVDSSKRYILISGGIGVEVIDGKTAERELSDIWTFDIDVLLWLKVSSNTFSSVNTMSRYGHQAVAFGESEIFIFGGENNSYSRGDHLRDKEDSEKNKPSLHCLSIHLDPPWLCSDNLI